jgi:hypothetical protein
MPAQLVVRPSGMHEFLGRRFDSSAAFGLGNAQGVFSEVLWIKITADPFRPPLEACPHGHPLRTAGGA